MFSPFWYIAQLSNQIQKIKIISSKSVILLDKSFCHPKTDKIPNLRNQYIQWEECEWLRKVSVLHEKHVIWRRRGWPHNNYCTSGNGTYTKRGNQMEGKMAEKDARYGRGALTSTLFIRVVASGVPLPLPNTTDFWRQLKCYPMKSTMHDLLL